MDITYLEIVDWEPAILRFFIRDYSDEMAVLLERMITGWLKSDARRGLCKCRYRFVEFRREPSAGVVEARTEWLCRKCAQALVDLVASHFPELTKVELGYSFV